MSNIKGNNVYTPRQVFDNPDEHMSFLTSKSDSNFESHYFDRKEAGRLNNGSMSQSSLENLPSQITECVSAFANADGGLLVLGISKDGSIKGIRHLSENQINRITSLNQHLKCQTTSIKFFDCINDQGIQDKIILILVHKSENGLCETIAANPEAWQRIGPKNQQMTDDMRDLLKREKRITDFERTFCCPFDPSELDQQVVNEFRRAVSGGAQLNDQELLYQVGAVEKDSKGLFFNNAGYLFFANNPMRVLNWAHVRLLRFNAKVSEFKNSGLPTFDQIFDGPLPQQIRKLRVHFRESGFIKIYQKRNPDGGFIEEPELPRIAIDEAIVNAIVHRDYGVQLPIDCRLYRDGLVVENPGRINQRGQILPNEFSLSDVTLDSSPRNPKIMQWMRSIRDDQGAIFVQALSEGTRQMRNEMTNLNLPAPLYNTEPKRTILILNSNAEERELRYRRSENQNNPEYANIFPITLSNQQGLEASSDIFDKRYKEVVSILKDALKAKDWYIDDVSFSRISAHRRGIEIQLPAQVSAYIRFYPAYIFQIREFYRKFFLTVDYTLFIKNVSRVSELVKILKPETLYGKRCVALSNNNWSTGRIVSSSPESTCVHFDDAGNDEYVRSDKVIPDLPMDFIKQLVKEKTPQFDLSREIKRHSLAIDPNSSRLRSEKTIATMNDISQHVFPLTIGDITLSVSSAPMSLSRFEGTSEFHVVSLTEPIVEFHHQQGTPDIRNGITRYGSYQADPKTLELIPICLSPYRDHMAVLIDRLKTGKYKYVGSERTFSTRLSYNTIVTVKSSKEILSECKRIISEHLEWTGQAQLSRLFLVHTPESGYALDDEFSPYYLVKKLLLESGIPCQMIDTPTLENPDWKDLNLALNIIAKCGVTPWVLPDRIPDADFFIGLSFTQNRRNGLRRLLGYATVFNQFGKWEFYTGNTETFSYDDREIFFDQLTQQTLKQLAAQNSLSDRPNIYFHYSAKFSNEDRFTILQAARKVRPNGTYSFVSINTHHNIRLYDNRPETDGSLARGCYIPTSQKTLLLSTTGYNPYRKAIGTPKPLEISVRVEPPINENYAPIDLHALASQILSLTKLNWASTDSVCGEPITTKYAGDIAYLTDAFLRQSDSFKLHPVLERTPWFI